MNRRKSLANYLGIKKSEVEKSVYGENVFDADGAEYLVLTDDEADESAAEYIKDSLWAFNASFLSGYTGLDECIFKALQDKCEDANDAFLSLVESNGGIDGLIEDAISADGRGHFLSGYDGNESENGEYFIYRTS